MSSVIYIQDADLTIHQGDCRQVLRELPDESVDCVATSPPFFGLRDYGTGSWDGGDPDCDHAVRTEETREKQLLSTTLGGGTATVGHAQEGYRNACARCGARRVDQQIGLEDSPGLWVAELVAVFRECRRVLRPHGTLWIECGDSYAGSWGNQGRKEERGTQRPINGPMLTPVHDGRYPSRGSNTGAIPEGTNLKPKDLLGTPWLLAFALRADGWWLRQAIIWHKPNAMPESVMDRCTTAHSYVFLLSKKPRYWFDGDAIAEPAAWERWGDQTTPKHNSTDTAAGWIAPKSKKELLAESEDKALHRLASTTMSNHSRHLGRETGSGSKHPRSVWTIPTRGYPGAHFATWPEALAERIVKAGCPEWVCRTCQRPRERIMEVERRRPSGLDSQHKLRALGRADGNLGANGPTAITETVGWSDCGHNNYRPGVILDPFGGAGTTGLVARRHGRHAILIELNGDYCRMAAERTQQLSVLAEETL